MEISCVFSKVQQREKHWSRKSPLGNSIWVCKLLPVVLYFQTLPHLEEGSCLATKHNCHPSQPEDLELKVSVGKRGGESTALSLLTNSLFKFFSKTAGEGVGRVDRNHPHSASHRCRDVVCRNGACTAKGLLSLRTHTAAARGLSGDSLFGKCQLIAAQTLKGT